MLAKIFLWSWRGELVHGTSDRAKSNVLTLEFRLFLRTHLSYRKISRTHSTPVSTTKLLFVLTSDSCVLTLDALVSQLYSLHANLMQGSHSSIFDVLCTRHFRFTNKQIVLTTVPGEMYSLQNVVIFARLDEFQTRNLPPNACNQWWAPPLLLLRRAA